MQTIHQPSTLFYITIAAFSVFTIILFINWLSWPIAAGLTLGFSLFIQTMYAAKKTYEFWAQLKEKDYSLDLFQDMDMNVNGSAEQFEGNFRGKI